MRDHTLPTEVRGDRVLLRDPVPGDVEARLRWVTVETEWQDWDAPWEGRTIVTPARMEAAKANLRDQIAGPLPSPRVQLWVQAAGGPLLGWVNHYHYDPAARVTWGGIVICESASWGRGLGTEALGLWLDYLFAHLDIDAIRLGTWSGNVRMVRVAEKCGFALATRAPGTREVRGAQYDALQFALLRPQGSAQRGAR